MDEVQDLLTAPPLQELAAGDCRFRAVVDMSVDAYYDWDISTGDNYFSEHLDDLLGQPPGRTRRWFYAWLELLHADDRERTLRSLAAAFRSEQTWREDYRLSCADGSSIWVEDHGVIVRDDRGLPARMIGTIRDITREREASLALQRSAELHRGLFLGAANPAVHVGRDGRYLDANEAALAFLECTRERLLSMMFWDHFPRGLAEVVQHAFTSESRIETEVSLTVAGTPKTLIVALVPCRIGGEDTFFCLGTDISSHQMLEDRLRDTNTALRVVLEQVNEDKLELQKRITANIDLLITPTLDRLDRQLHGRPEAEFVQALRENLGEILRPFAARLTAPDDGSQPLTRRELEVAGYVRMGKTTDQIADIMCLSRSAVQFHRGNIRRKLGLGRGDGQLGATLSTLLVRQAE